MLSPNKRKRLSDYWWIIGDLREYVRETRMAHKTILCWAFDVTYQGLCRIEQELSRPAFVSYDITIHI